MIDKEAQRDDRPPALKPEEYWVPIYEMRNLSEILRDWLPWRKKKRKDR